MGDDEDPRAGLFNMLGRVPATASSLETVRRMLQNDGDVNACSKTGATPLMVAVSAATHVLYADIDDDPTDPTLRNFEIPQLLLEWTANPNKTEDPNRHLMPLMIAACAQSVELCRLLVRAKADLNCRTPEGLAARDFAGPGCEELNLLLGLEPPGLREQRLRKLTATEQYFLRSRSALWNGRLYSVNRQLAECRDTDMLLRFADRDGHNLLHLACSNEPPEAILSESVRTRHAAVKILLRHSASVEQRNMLSETPLLVAVRECTARQHCPPARCCIVRTLLLQKSDPNVIDDVFRETPLMEAACRGHVALVTVLLEFQADPNFVAESGLTAFSHATVGEHTEVISLLQRASEGKPVREEPVPQLPQTAWYIPATCKGSLQAPLRTAAGAAAAAAASAAAPAEVSERQASEAEAEAAEADEQVEAELLEAAAQAAAAAEDTSEVELNNPPTSAASAAAAAADSEPAASTESTADLSANDEQPREEQPPETEVIDLSINLSLSMERGASAEAILLRAIAQLRASLSSGGEVAPGSFTVEEAGAREEKQQPRRMTATMRSPEANAATADGEEKPSPSSAPAAAAAQAAKDEGESASSHKEAASSCSTEAAPPRAVPPPFAAATDNRSPGSFPSSFTPGGASSSGAAAEGGSSSSCSGFAGAAAAEEEAAAGPTGGMYAGDPDEEDFFGIFAPDYGCCAAAATGEEDDDDEDLEECFIAAAVAASKAEAAAEADDPSSTTATATSSSSGSAGAASSSSASGSAASSSSAAAASSSKDDCCSAAAAPAAPAAAPPPGSSSTSPPKSFGIGLTARPLFNDFTSAKAKAKFAPLGKINRPEPPKAPGVPFFKQVHVGRGFAGYPAAAKFNFPNRKLGGAPFFQGFAAGRGAGAFGGPKYPGPPPPPQQRINPVLARHYATLGVRNGASAQEVRQAYHKLALQYHPDKNAGDEEAAEKFKKIKDAYDALQ